MLYFNRINVSEETDANKTSEFQRSVMFLTIGIF